MVTFPSQPDNEVADEPAPGSTAAVCEQERELIESTLAGNTGAYGQLVRTHQSRVYNFVYQLTRNRHDTDDLVQQTFIKAFHHLRQFDASRPMINWLLTIARNTTLNHFRDTKRWTELSFEAVGSEPTPAQSADLRERAAGIWDRARTLLSPREFEVLWLRFAEELSTRETARVVGLTETHVKVLVFRARQALLKEGGRT